MHPTFAAIDGGDIQLVHGLLHMNPAALNGVVGDFGQSPLMHVVSNMDRTFEPVEFPASRALSRASEP